MVLKNSKTKIDPEKIAAFKEKGVQHPESEKPKRVRRSREEIDSERLALHEDGFEIFATAFKMGSDNDNAKYGFEKQPIEFFEPLARQWACIFNYFLPKAKPIYFACISVTIGSYTMLKTRSELIKEKVGNGSKQPGKKDNLDPGKAGTGKEFPGQTEVTRI